jgi:Flp pilus assembly protein TadG
MRLHRVQPKRAIGQGSTTLAGHAVSRPGRRRRRGDRRGAAVVEFAVVAPVFFMMIIGFIEFSRAMMVQQVLVSASRVGARTAITLNATTTEVNAAVQSYTQGLAVSGVSAVVSPSPDVTAPGDLITVTASVPYADVSWLPSAWFLGGKLLTCESTMRKEGFN